MLELQYYKSNQGVFFKVEQYGYHTPTLMAVCDFVDDTPSADIVQVNKWYRSKEVPTKLQKYQAEKIEPIGFDLKESHLASAVIPVFLSLEEVQEYYDDDLEVFKWKFYESVRALYTTKYKLHPKQLTEVEFKSTYLGMLEIQDYQAPESMKVKFLREGAFGAKVSDEKDVDLSTVVVYSDIEKMLTPEFLIHTRPCKLTSKQVYGIVRTHIIQNYDPKECYIDSNYDFCFSVTKYINTKPYQGDTLVRVRNKWGSKKTTLNQKKVKIFEMTYAGYKGVGGYEGYTCIEEWKADSLKELQEKIKDYLDQLIQYINTYCVECDNCKGFGYHVKTLTTNQREF